MELRSSQACHGGWQNVYSHPSKSCACDMTFAVYLPPQAEASPVPVLWYLSGLTCTHENAMTKAQLQCFASEHGIAVIYPDTSPRGESVPNDSAYDLGQGAGFYVNATQSPWSEHFQMFDYLDQELPALISKELSQIDMSRQGITGHSMGGHGALVLAMRRPDRFVSLSAFSPICNPLSSEWGRKQFSAYLGDDESLWKNFDATHLMKEHGWKTDLLIDQGSADEFLSLLLPESMEQAMADRQQAGVLRYHEGYDHSYFFISTFAKDHVEWHATRLLKPGEA